MRTQQYCSEDVDEISECGQALTFIRDRGAGGCFQFNIGGEQYSWLMAAHSTSENDRLDVNPPPDGSSGPLLYQQSFYLDLVPSQLPSDVDKLNDTQRKRWGYYFYYTVENKIFVARNADFFERSLTLQEAGGSHTLHGANAEEHELGDLNEPPNYKAALSDPEFDKWLDVINAEMQSMKDKSDVWLIFLLMVEFIRQPFSCRWRVEMRFQVLVVYSDMVKIVNVVKGQDVVKPCVKKRRSKGEHCNDYLRSKGVDDCVSKTGPCWVRGIRFLSLKDFGKVDDGGRKFSEG
uniref:Uncharacterized protein n=1 Tax=Tanacetum cinerariifolium TaxID=118510 RepID=A0A699IA44_TANCI|nr:hypothetical protein [Tanacetum cinerariifolium]